MIGANWGGGKRLLLDHYRTGNDKVKSEDGSPWDERQSDNRRDGRQDLRVALIRSSQDGAWGERKRHQKDNDIRDRASSGRLRANRGRCFLFQYKLLGGGTTTWSRHGGLFTPHEQNDANHDSAQHQQACAPRKVAREDANGEKCPKQSRSSEHTRLLLEQTLQPSWDTGLHLIQDDAFNT